MWDKPRQTTEVEDQYASMVILYDNDRDIVEVTC